MAELFSIPIRLLKEFERSEPQAEKDLGIFRLDSDGTFVVTPNPDLALAFHIDSKKFERKIETQDGTIEVEAISEGSNVFIAFKSAANSTNEDDSILCFVRTNGLWYDLRPKPSHGILGNDSLSNLASHSSSTVQLDEELAVASDENRFHFDDQSEQVLETQIGEVNRGTKLLFATLLSFVLAPIVLFVVWQENKSYTARQAELREKNRIVEQRLIVEGNDTASTEKKGQANTIEPSNPVDRTKDVEEGDTKVDADVDAVANAKVGQPEANIQQQQPTDFPTLSWDDKQLQVSDVELGQMLKFPLFIKSKASAKPRIFVHFGKWEKNESELIEYKGPVPIPVEMTRDNLIDFRNDDDGHKRATVAFQVLVTNGEKPYADENDRSQLKEGYEDMLLRREEFPVRIHVNRRPYFPPENAYSVEGKFIRSPSTGNDLSLGNAEFVVKGDTDAKIRLQAADVDGAPNQPLTYEQLLNNKWVSLKSREFKIDSSQSGNQSVTFRAKDTGDRYSQPIELSFIVNHVPTFEKLQILPDWPVPSGPVRIYASGRDKDNDRLRFDITAMVNGQRVKLRRRDSWDSEGDRPVSSNAVLYELHDLPPGSISVKATLNDDVGLFEPVSDSANKKIVPTTPVKLPSNPTTITNSLGLTFVQVPAGEFTMGSPDNQAGRNDDEPLHGVRITKPFYIQQAEFPAQLRHHLLIDEATAKNQRGPANKVSWAEAQHLCDVLNKLESERASGRTYRLPTEAEWEYACRAGTTTATSFGNTISSKQANFKGDPYNGAEVGPSLGMASKVGNYPANPWGLHDMHGNTCEWCRDWFHARLPGGRDPDLYAAKATALKNRTGDYSRVRRGGTWADDGWPNRSAFRQRFEPERRYDHIGFRVVAVQL